MKDEYVTRQTLLQRAKDPDDDQAWEEFVSYYESFIFILLRHMNIPQQDCDDLTQTVLIRVWKKLATFDPSRAKFRTWLSTIIRNAVLTHIESSKRRQNRHDKYSEEQTISHEMTAKSQPEFEKVMEREWKAYITNIAMKNIRDLFSGNAITVFDLSLDNHSIEEISEKLGIQPNSVYKLKNRVKDRLVKEIRRLREELEL